MVVLNKSKMMRNAVYFGKSQARGSNKKMVNIGMGMVPFGSGSGMTTFGSGLTLHGQGMRLLGTGSLFGKLKKLAKPLLTKGKDVLKKQADEELVKAMPFLEKSDELQPNDKVVLSALKDIYVRTNNMEKLKIVNQKLAKLK